MTVQKHFEELRKKLTVVLVEVASIKREYDIIKKSISEELKQRLLSHSIDYKESLNYDSMLLIIGNTVNISYDIMRRELLEIRDALDKESASTKYNFILSIANVRKFLMKLTEGISQLTLFYSEINHKDMKTQSRLNDLVKKTDYLDEILRKLINMLYPDDGNVRAAEKKKSFLELFSRNYRSKINTGFNLGNKIINLQVRSMFRIEDSIVGNKLLRDTLEDFIDVLSKKSHNNQEGEQRILSLSLMDDKQLQDMIIKFINNTIIYALKSSPELIRASRANIYVGIYTADKYVEVGQYRTTSYYDNIFITIQLTQTMLYYILEGFEKMPNKSEEYNTIIHEFTHSYDWILNNPVTNKIAFNDELYRATWSIIGGEPYPETMAYAKILINLREEGLADLSATIKSQLSKYVASIIDMRELFLELGKNDDLINFTSNIYSNKSSSIQVLNQVHTLYRTGAVHNWGKFMAWLILISKLNERIYFLVSENALPDKAIVELMHGLLDFDAVKEKYGLKVIKGQDLGDENRKLTKHIYLVIFRKDKKLTDQLITALSITSIDKFLEYYEEALKFTHIPEIGISSGIMKAINKNIKNKIAIEAKNQGFEWYS